ncbi:uncharacterized protein LOC132291321 isoform X2 [Cornus florida]|uniref:uncharacterized protein LOC132291321 isoform X2 n=1 Tax=Cornus florida TaxID=4283 RepID=UPI002896A3B3|nr:uncharacterized protein LOC132291321 isoform X2 [Cornus florida]
MASSTTMSSSVVDFGCSITSPNQMQSKQQPHSIQNPSPNTHKPNFDFTSFSSNTNTSSDQSQSSSHADSKTTSSSNLGKASEGGFNSNLHSPFASGMSSEKSNFSGRSKPRLVKLRRHSGSQHGRSTTVPPQNDSGFNPFRSVSESSDRVKDATITSNGFGASIVDVKIGANNGNSVSNSNSEHRESSGSAPQSNASEIGKFENVGFVFDSNRNTLLTNLNLENSQSESTGQSGANVDFVFGAMKSDSVPNSKSQQRESNVSMDFLGAVGSGKFNNADFAFGVNNKDLDSNSKSEQFAKKSEERDAGEGSRKLSACEFGISDIKSNLNSESEESGFVFDFKLDSSTSSLKLETIESSENVEKNDGLRGKRKEENKTEFRKLDKGGFVFDTNHRDSKNKESSENFGLLASDMRGEMKLDSEADSGNLNNVGYVFGQEWTDLGPNLNSENSKAGKNVRKSVSIDRLKMESGEKLGKFDNGGSVFGAYQSASAPHSDLHNSEFSKNVGKPVFEDRGHKIVNIETGFQETTPEGVFISGNNSEKNSSFSGRIKFCDDTNKVNGDDSGYYTGFAKVRNSDVNNRCSIFGGGIGTASASGACASPVLILTDEMKNLKIVDHEKVGDSDISKDSNVNSCANNNFLFVFGSNKKVSGSSTSSSGTASSHQIKNSNSEGHGSGSTFEKSEKHELETGDLNSFVFTNVNDAYSLGGGLENLELNGKENKNTRNSMGATDEEINLGSPSQKEKQPINVNEKSSDDPSIGVSTPKSFIFHARSAKSFDGPRDQKNDDVKLNKASSQSSFSSSGLAFEAPSTAEVEDGNKFSFSSTLNFRKPNLDVPCSFTLNLFPGLDKTMESNAKSRSTRDKGLKKTRAKLRLASLLQEQSRQDQMSKEGISQHIPESPGLYSPMDFSPYQDNNCAPSAGTSTISTHSKDEDLVATREGDDIKEADSKYRKPNENGSMSHGESSCVADYLSEKFVSRVDTECSNAKIEQVSINGSAGAVEDKAGVCSNIKSEESDCRKQYRFASSSEDTGKRDFTFSAISPKANVSAVKRQNKKKYRIKVGRVSNSTTPSQKLEFSSSSVQFSPLSCTSSRLNAAQDKKEEKFEFQSKRENKFKAFEELVKQAPATAAAQDACEKWRIRGNQAYKNGYLSKAEDFYTKGVNCVPHNEASGCCLEPLVLCYSNRAATRMSLGRMREALRDCLVAAELDPNFLKVQIRAANCHLALGEVEDALQYFRKCLESKSGVCLDRRIMIEAADGIQKAQKVAECTNRCAELLLQRSYDAATSALGIIAEALSLSTYSEKLLEMKGEAFFMLRKYEEVIQLCEQTLDFAEKNFSVLVADNNSAEADVSKFKNSFVRLWRWHLMSKSYFHLGRLEVALDLLEKQELWTSGSDKYGSMPQGSSTLLAVNVRELLHRKNAGNEAFQSARHTEAVDHYTAAISSSFESRPFAAICFCNRAAAHQALGQLADAIADCSLAIALNGKYPKAVSRRATLHEKIRDYEQAASDLQRLICVLEKQSQEKVQQSSTPDGPNGSNVKELRQARRRISLMEEKAKKGISLDLYLILGVKASDSASEIKKAYRKAALRHHPDKAGQFLARSEGGDDGQLWKDIVEEVHKDADRLFKMIGEAYAVLSDPSKRSEYDLQEELRRARKESSGSSASGRPSDFYSSPFESSPNRRYWQESWKTYGNSPHSRW